MKQYRFYNQLTMSTNTVFAVYFLFICLFCAAGKQYKSEDIQYAVRVTNVSDCPGYEDKPLLTDVKWTTNGYTQYMSMTSTVQKPVVVQRLMVYLEKCRDYQYACEYFQTWNFTSYCSIVRMKNQIWSPIVNSITPQTWQRTCPKIDKGVYKVQNSSIDINALIRFYNEATKYHWRGNAYAYNQKNENLYCVYVAGHVITYLKRERTTAKPTADDMSKNRLADKV